jgi:CHAT domain-containing protein
VKATANALAAAGRECGLLHYSGHAEFNPKEPLKSKLMLTGEPLTLGQVFGGMRLHRNRLVVLSGCESGLLVPDVLDDYWSFTTGFLYAGAQSVVSALWEIPDLPSAMLMNKFYAFWLGGKPAAGALQEAQRWLRTLRRGDEFDGAVEALTRNLEDRTMARQCSKAAAKYVAALGEHPFACPIHWAAFTCSGAGYGQPGMRQ